MGPDCYRFLKAEVGLLTDDLEKAHTACRWLYRQTVHPRRTSRFRARGSDKGMKLDVELNEGEIV